MLLAIGPISYLHVAIIYLFPMIVWDAHRYRQSYVSASNRAASTCGSRKGLIYHLHDSSAYLHPLLSPIRLKMASTHLVLFKDRLMVFAALSMLAIEVGGHLYASHHHTTREISCFFISEYRCNSNFYFSQTLELHPIILAISNFFSGIAAPLITSPYWSSSLPRALTP